jgi:Haem degrading protein HbpS-like
LKEIFMVTLNDARNVIAAAEKKAIWTRQIFAGGVPLKRNGQVEGAVGVSGGSGAQDQAVAEAGAAAFK